MTIGMEVSVLSLDILVLQLAGDSLVIVIILSTVMSRTLFV